MKTIEFTDTEQVVEILTKLDKILPEQKIHHGALNDMLSEGGRVSDVKVTVRPIVEDKPGVLQTAEDKVKKPKDKSTQKSIKAQEGEKPKIKFTKPKVIKDLKDLPKAIKEEEKNSHSTEKGIINKR